MTDLKQMHSDVLAHARSKDLAIFPTLAFPAEMSWVLPWDSENEDWRSFVDVGKDAGARYLIVDAQKGQGERSGEIGRIVIVWISGGMVHTFTAQADWWGEALEPEVPSKDWVTVSVAPEEAEAEGGFSKALKEEPAERLAEELVEFVETKFPDTESWGVKSIARLFWQKKGSRHGYYPDDPDAGMKMQEVEALAGKNLEDRRWEREKTLLPDLIEECVEWGHQRTLKKLGHVFLGHTHNWSSPFIYLLITPLRLGARPGTGYPTCFRKNSPQ